MASNSVEQEYVASMGIATISTANTNLDGTGAIASLITGAQQGTYVKTIIIKAQTDVQQGMIRFFVQLPGGTKTLLTEVFVADTIKSGRDLSFQQVMPVGYTLAFEEQLLVSTEKSDTFNIIVEAFDIQYLVNTNYLGSSTEFIANSGVEKITVANPNLDGTGTLVKIIAAATGTGFNGCALKSIILKAQQNTTPGMIRLFIEYAGTTTLFHEIKVPSVIRSGSTVAFQLGAISSGTLCIPSGAAIWASTENGERFSVVIEAADWKNV